ncbi:MAG: alginate O-acetyltransferase AlgX-related protein [Hyphomicrobiaceae bacterium]
MERPNRVLNVLIAAGVSLAFLSPMVLLLAGFANTRMIDNRSLTPWPAFAAASVIDTKFYTGVKNYLVDRFPFRPHIIVARGHVMQNHLADFNNDRIVWGKDGWMFLREAIRFSCHKPDLMAQAVRGMTTFTEYVRRMGKDVVFMMAPNKATIYPEKVADRFAPYLACENKHRALFHAMVRNRGDKLRYIDVFAPTRHLQLVRRSLGLPGDSHSRRSGAARSVRRSEEEAAAHVRARAAHVRHFRGSRPALRGRMDGMQIDGADEACQAGRQHRQLLRIVHIVGAGTEGRQGARAHDPRLFRQRTEAPDAAGGAGVHHVQHQQSRLCQAGAGDPRRGQDLCRDRRAFGVRQFRASRAPEFHQAARRRHEAHTSGEQPGRPDRWSRAMTAPRPTHHNQIKSRAVPLGQTCHTTYAVVEKRSGPVSDVSCWRI